MGVRQAGGQLLAKRAVCVILFGPAVACAGEGLPSIESVVTHMAQARIENRTHLRPYTVTRNYKLIGKEKQTPGRR